jgi:hypothetical protein
VFSARLLVILLIVVSAACRGPQQKYATLPAGAEALKQQFNADAARTRILILPAPN